MTNIDMVGIKNVLKHIPTNEEFTLLDSYEEVKEFDRIANVSYGKTVKDFKVTWFKLETKELGLPCNLVGQVVIRPKEKMLID